MSTPAPASASERTPLISNARPEQSQADAQAIESAFNSALDPNASAFAAPIYSHADQAEAGIPEAPEPDEQAEAPLVSDPPPRADLFIVLGGLWIGTFLAALDGTIVATVLSTIGSQFGRSNEVSWLGTAFVLAQCAFQPLYGKFSDIFGRKPATLFASAVFLIGTLLCGVSTSFEMLVLSRAVAGIGGGGLTTMASIVTSDLIPLKQRGVYQGFGNIVYAGGAALGGPIGGLLGDSVGWKWAFLIQVPICFLHFGVVAWKVNIPSGPGDVWTKIKRIDALGALTLVSSVTLFLVGMSLGGNELPWNSPTVYGSIIASLVILVLFVVVEKYVAREPLMPLKVLFVRTPGSVSLTNWFISMSQFGIIYNIPLYFSAVGGTSTSYAGLHLIPNAVFASATSLASGIYMSHTGKYKVLLIIMGVLGVLGPLLMATTWTRGRTTEAEYWIEMIPAGTGYGGMITITLVALISAVQPQDMAAATGISYLFRATGSVLGISLSTSILQNTLKSELPKVITGPDAAKIIQRIREDVDYIKTLPHDLREAAIGAYEHAMRVTFVAIALAALFALFSILFIKEHPLPGRLDRKK